jgi:hypothetical protein
MEKAPFFSWLTGERGLSEKAARDAISRCKRIEDFLKVPLERAVSSQGSFNNCLERVREGLDKRNDLMYSIRLFAEFRNPRIKPQKYGFYGPRAKLRTKG